MIHRTLSRAGPGGGRAGSPPAWPGWPWASWWPARSATVSGGGRCWPGWPRSPPCPLARAVRGARRGRAGLLTLLVPLFVIVAAFGMLRPNGTALAFSVLRTRVL
jgi:hypothetical protein